MSKVEEAKALEKRLEEEYLEAQEAARKAEEEPAEVPEEADTKTDETTDSTKEDPDKDDKSDEEIPPVDEAVLNHAKLQLDYDKLQRTHSVLEGKYNAEVPKLAAELREMRAEQKKAIRDARNESFKGDLSKIKEDHGDELARLLEASLHNNEPVENDSTEMESKLSYLEEQIEAGKQKAFLTELSYLYPKFAQTNADPRWLQWLGENGYQGLIDVAHEELNAQGIANVFKLYDMQQLAIRKAQEPPKKVVNEKLEGKIDPSKSTSGSAQKAPDAPLSAKEIDRLQKKAEKLGRSSNRMKRAEADKILTELMTRLTA